MLVLRAILRLFRVCFVVSPYLLYALCCCLFVLRVDLKVACPGCWAKATVLLWCLSLIYALLSWAVDVSKYHRHHVVDLVTKYTFGFACGDSTSPYNANLFP